MAHDILALEDTVNTYLSKIAPPTFGNAADAIFDTDYTMLALKRTGDGARDWWTSFLSTVRRLDNIGTEPIRSFLSTDVRNFRESRRALEAAQKTFDSLLARYVGQSKTKEPSALREDAFALYEARKAYLKVSMDFCQMAPQLRFGLDKLLVRISADTYREMRKSRDVTGSTRWSNEMERIRGWSKEMESSEPMFRRELQIARREIGETTLMFSKPPRDLEPYSASTVPFIGSRGPMNMQSRDKGAVISEKQGWLFLRVFTGKPVRTSWVRRWYYCREGVFGWLVQAPQGVLQGDEIGVLLCSAKPAVGEERRFCFEVKTKTQTLMLQAETQGQLIEWLEVFEVAKKKAMEASLGRDSGSFPGGIDPAFAVTPPSMPEFSAKLLDGLEEGATVERSGTLPVPGPEGALSTRASFDVAGGNAPPRRSITTLGRELGREEGETGREHASRIMQRLDLHRRTAFGGSEQSAGPRQDPGAGGIASLISASHTLLPSYTGSPGAVLGGSSRPTPLFAQLDSEPGNLAPVTMAKPPILTSLSKGAVLASAERYAHLDSGRGIPAAAIANYWGSNSWRSFDDSRSQDPGTPQPNLDDPFIATIQAPSPAGSDEHGGHAVSLHRKTMSVDADLGAAKDVLRPLSESFPAGYPYRLRAQHAQFRLLFPSVPLDEKLVLVFNAAWQSYSEQGKQTQSLLGNGRIYVTPDNMYFYGHQMGLVVSYTVNLDIISEVTSAPGKDCDFIYLHLGQDMNETGFTRISIKTFLDDLPLLHARLNFLVDDLQAEEPMDLEHLIATLINLEKEQYDKKSPSAESWEEISANTPVDNGTAAGRAVPRRSEDHRLKSPRGAKHAAVPKFQLPTHTVVFEPEGMGRSVAERHFEISAKACFHVLFGDKSFLFPKLYFDHRAKEIAQGPWEAAEHGALQRQFKFKVDFVNMLGQSSCDDITDTQTVDIFNDHITYAITYVRVPWHLPQSQSFRIVTKIVITHIAKSKCKLAIFTKIDWGKTAAFAKSMVQRQALNDAANDADELAELATDQVRKLGPHSRTKRAIQVYGQVGQQKQVVVFTPNAAADAAKKTPIRVRSLTSMALETARSFMESAITSVMMWTFAGLRKMFHIVSAHRLILFLLVASSFYNIVITSKGTSTWWAERKAAKYMNSIGVGPNLMMSKAVYLADLEEASRGSSISYPAPEGSVCYETFQSILNSTDLDAPYEDAGVGFSTSTSRAAARRIRRTRQRLGSYRHDLLVAMRIVNGVEAEMVQSEWENWLSDEHARCDRVHSVLLQDASSTGDVDNKAAAAAAAARKTLGREMGQKVLTSETKERLKNWHDEYCGSCERDHGELSSRTSSMVL